MDNQQNKLMPVGQLFSKSFEVYKDKFRILTKISALNFLAFVAFLPFVAIFIVLSISNRYNLTLFLSGILFLLIGILILIILGLWIYASLFFAAKEGNGQTKIKEIMPKSWKKSGPLFWILFLSGLVNIGGFILLIIPGIIFSVWFSFSQYAFVVDDTRGVAALKRSKELVRGYWWPVFGRTILIMIITFLISSIRFFGSIINILFLTPFIIVFFSSLYEDLKRVKI